MKPRRHTATTEHVDTHHPLDDSIHRRAMVLPVQSIQPLIRVAHRVRGPLDIASRIIFDHELVLIIRGTGTLAFPGQTYRFGPRDLFFIPPFLPHEFHSDAVCEHSAIHFDLAPDVPRRTSTVEARKPYHITLTQGLRFPPHTVLLHNDPIAQSVDRIIALRGTGDSLDQLATRKELLDILILLLKRQRQAGQVRRSPQQTLAQARMERALAFVRSQWKTITSADQVASAAGVSVSQLNRINRIWTGQSIMETVRRAKVEHARDLLAQATLSIKEIAAACGFADPYHFSKVFRRIDGLPPSEYRASLLKTPCATESTV